MKQIFQITILLFLLLLKGSYVHTQTIVTDNNLIPIEGFGLVKDPKSSIVYFGKIDSVSSTAIYSAILKEGKISSIKKKTILSNTAQETIPFFSTDGQSIFLFSNYGNLNKKNLDLWLGEYNKGEIKNLKKVTEISTDSVEYYGCMTKNGTLYFSSWRPEGNGKGDIFYSKLKKGVFSPAKHLGNSINTDMINSSPAVSPKGDWLIFYNGTDSGTDLSISFWLKNKWSKAIKLPESVNTENFEFAPVISHNGKTLYFSRREKSHSSEEQVYHIYQISIDQLGLKNLKQLVDH